MSAVDLLGHTLGAADLVRIGTKQAAIPTELLDDKLGNGCSENGAQEWGATVAHDSVSAIQSRPGRDGLDRIKILEE